ncbi:hypothetical protein FO519_007375 [Halicephalobus sp. NKZ332]|nr:hypothetical protein FO519_007375 [Halicephalobus sp. NKZ332]
MAVQSNLLSPTNSLMQFLQVATANNVLFSPHNHLKTSLNDSATAVRLGLPQLSSGYANLAAAAAAAGQVGNQQMNPFSMYLLAQDMILFFMIYSPGGDSILHVIAVMEGDSTFYNSTYRLKR